MENYLVLPYRAFFSISTFNISTFANNVTYTCFVYWCMHLYSHDLVHDLYAKLPNQLQNGLFRIKVHAPENGVIGYDYSIILSQLFVIQKFIISKMN